MVPKRAPRRLIKLQTNKTILKSKQVMVRDDQQRMLEALQRKGVSQGFMIRRGLDLVLALPEYAALFDNTEPKEVAEQ